MAGELRQITLADGRRLAFCEYGVPQGKPIFYFHGWPGSRLEAQLAEPTARRFNARLIGIDRPGMGGSDFKPNRALLDWPLDVGKLADVLGLDRFAVAGVSGGGPYALACARRIPERLTAVAVVCGLGPLESPSVCAAMSPLARRTFYLCRNAPWLLRMVFARTAWKLKRDFKWYLKNVSDALPQADKQALLGSDFKDILVASTLEAVRSGTRGTAWEGRIYASPWAFRLEDISKEVHLWHGEDDATVPASMGRHVAETLFQCRPRFCPREGHFSLITNHMAEFFEVLTA
ncbi:MAG TPA: alpha/beta hydrolase [Candidatus Binatia bacterium]|jgi:pimeloyl-ACP methyl ester carboxylesterase